MARVMVTGASGFVGSNIAEVLMVHGHDVVGLLRHNSDATSLALPWAAVTADHGDAAGVHAVVERVTPDAVVHCAISNDFTLLDSDRRQAHDAYVGLTSRITRAAQACDAQMIQISTDWVHDGRGHLVTESEPPNPVNIYGVLKALCEQVVLDVTDTGAGPAGAIVRIGGVIGDHRVRAATVRQQDVGFGYFVAALLDSLSEPRQFAVWDGEGVNTIATPSLASDIGVVVERIIATKSAGIFSAVADDAINRHDLARRAARVFELDESLITTADVPEGQHFPAAVPVDTSMASGATRQRLRLTPRSIDDLLLSFRRERRTGAIS